VAGQLVGHQVRALVDVQVSGAEAERRDRDLGDLPCKDSLERAPQRAPHPSRDTAPSGC
jgi:hypothetical protein